MIRNDFYLELMSNLTSRRMMSINININTK